MTPYPRPLILPIAVATVALAPLLRPLARAEDSTSYKFENYREEDGRITVETQSGAADEDIGPLTHLRLTGTVDATSGATPTGQPASAGSDQVITTEIHERRKAWSGDVSQQLAALNVDVGFADSREEDYVSAGWSINTLTDFNQKNTTLRLGLAGTDDRVEVFFEPAYLPKHTRDAIVGITQLIDPQTFITLNTTIGRATGYLGEPHKLVEKSIDVFANVFLPQTFGENRPNGRNKETVFASLNHAFLGVRGAVEGSYRYYSDSYGIVANTAELSWVQHLGGKTIVEPLVRFYQQRAASFYYYDLDTTNIVPVSFPKGTAPYYSSDFRLSALSSMSYGLTVSWKARDSMQIDLAYEVYEMRGRDGITPASAYPTAGIATVGIKYLW